MVILVLVIIWLWLVCLVVYSVVFVCWCSSGMFYCFGLVMVVLMDIVSCKVLLLICSILCFIVLWMCLLSVSMLLVFIFGESIRNFLLFMWLMMLLVCRMFWM